jgi:isopenicillin N synthase-like dioxygenase
MGVVPIIDISGLSSGAAVKRSEVAAALDRACVEIGFFQVVGHGIDDGLIQRMYDVSRAFFALPAEKKHAVAQPDKDTIRGYSSIGEQALNYNDDPTAPGDLHEKFDVGPVDVPTGDAYYSRELAGTHFVPNPWPAEPSTMAAVWTEYFRACDELAARLMRGFALGLDLPEDWFEATIDRNISMLRAIHYPDQHTPPKPGQMRAGAHSDYGSLTLLRQEEAPGGLQVFTKDGDWVAVPVVPGALVVNIGDLMAQWTNDRWTSTRHRVANPPRGLTSGTDRMSLVFFHQPNYDAVVECIPTCLAEGDRPRYTPVTSGDHLLNKFRATFETSKAG